MTSAWRYDIIDIVSSTDQAIQAGVAQLVEQLICNQQVGGSSPSTSSKLPLQRTGEYGGIPEWPKGADCKSVVSDFGGSNPPSPTKAEPDEPSRFAWLLLCPNGLYDRRDICPGVSTCLCQEIKKEATTQGISCVVASLCSLIAITDFVIIYQNPARF